MMDCLTLEVDAVAVKSAVVGGSNLLVFLELIELLEFTLFEDLDIVRRKTDCNSDNRPFPLESLLD